MALPQSTLTLPNLLKQHLASDDKRAKVLEELAKAPYFVSTVAQLATYFDERSHIESKFVAKVEGIKDDGEIITA